VLPEIENAFKTINYAIEKKILCQGQSDKLFLQ